MSQCAHIVETVGEFDQDDTDILGHGKEHLSEIAGLHFLLDMGLIAVVAGKFEFFQLGDAVDQQRDIRSELFCDLFPGHDRIFNYVVQKACGDRLLVELEVRQDQRDIKGMDDVGLSGLSLLSFMRLSGHLIALFDQGYVVGGMVSADTLNNVRIQLFRT